VPDQIEIALAAAGHLEQESRQLEHQWASRGARRYEAERARRQHHAAAREPSCRPLGFGKKSCVSSRRPAAACALARARVACDWPGGTRRVTNARREPAADLEGHHVGSSHRVQPYRLCEGDLDVHGEACDAPCAPLQGDARWLRRSARRS
jgi:hypothetical protein